MSDLDLIREAALAAGQVALDLLGRGLDVQWKSGDDTPVTNGDLAVDALLKDRLLAARPDYGWLSEETADDPARLQKRKLFIVDPIDGTRAYAKVKPWFTVCIAVVENGQPTAGVVHAPALGHTYEAQTGGGAHRDGQPIHVTDCQALEACAMLAHAPMFNHPAWPEPWPPMRVESRNSVALRMALVADGSFDACFAPSGKHEWDLAAADLICREAGALVTDHKGRGFSYNRPVPRQPALVCAGPTLHRLLLARVAHIELPE
jgi:myo-inositol-1(or 4)-monophosphatase